MTNEKIGDGARDSDPTPWSWCSANRFDRDVVAAREQRDDAGELAALDVAAHCLVQIAHCPSLAKVARDRFWPRLAQCHSGTALAVKSGELLMKITSALLCLLAVACGGGSGSTSSNTATGKTFTYGAAVPATSTQTSAAQQQFATAASLGQVNSADAIGLVDVTALSDSLLGDTGFGAARAPQSASRMLKILPLTSQLSTDCISINGDTYTFDNCKYDSGTSVITINGSLTSPNSGAASWDLTYAYVLDDGTFSFNLALRYAGSLLVTDSAIKGTMLADITDSSSSGSFSVSEAVIIDVSYASPFCIDSGSLEVKRVWTTRPQGKTANTLPDAAVKIVWTGCKQATIASSGTASSTPSGHSISGKVSGATGVKLSLSGTASATTTADSSGNYSFSGLANGSYVVAPSLTGYTFAPANLSVALNGSDAIGKNFTGAAITTTTTTGRVISGTISTAIGTTVTLSGAASAVVTSDSSGGYSFSGLKNGSYTVTPSRAGYSFSPASIAVTLNGTDATSKNFAGSSNGTASCGATLTNSTPTVCSGAGTTEVTFFVNDLCSTGSVDVYWVDFNCHEVFYGTINANAPYNGEAFVTDAWRLRDHATQALLREIAPVTGSTVINYP
jgi:hypothetical protein